MDELFDYLRSAKTNRKRLVTVLISTEILGILAFIWILKEPLYQKFLQTPQKAYSLTQMNPQFRYLLAQNDQIQGYTDPSSKIAVLIRDADSVEKVGKIRATDTGVWFYQIPDDTSPGTKALTIAKINENNSVQSIENYRIRIIPNDIINLNKNNPDPWLSDLSITPQEIVPLISDKEENTTLNDSQIPTIPPPREDN